MARGKPLIFSKKPASSTRRRRKEEAESGFMGSNLSPIPPVELRGMAAARRAWRKIMSAHSKLPGQLFNGLDRDFLIGYCLAIQARHNALQLEKDITKKYSEGVVELADLLKCRTELRMSTRLVGDLEKQMYGTPRSRGGVTPPPKEVQDSFLDELDEMKSLLREGE
jgi:hypothetical protein